MNPEIKTQWVAALRSGEYQKGIGSLVKVVGDEGETGSDAKPGTVAYCCLGVLTDLAVKAGVENVRITTTSGEPVVEVDNDDPEGPEWVEFEEGDLPAEVRVWAGLDSANPTIDGIPAITLNDGESDQTEYPPRSFAEIADAIERDETL